MKTFTIHFQVGYEKGAFLKLLAGIKTSDFKRFRKLTQFVVYVYVCVVYAYYRYLFTCFRVISMPTILLNYWIRLGQ